MTSTAVFKLEMINQTYDIICRHFVRILHTKQYRVCQLCVNGLSSKPRNVYGCKMSLNITKNIDLLFYKYWQLHYSLCKEIVFVPSTYYLNNFIEVALREPAIKAISSSQYPQFQKILYPWIHPIVRHILFLYMRNYLALKSN